MRTTTIPILALTVDDVAQAIRCSRSKVKTLISAKNGEPKLASIKIDGMRRVRLPDLRAYVDAQSPAMAAQLDDYLTTLEAPTT